MSSTNTIPGDRICLIMPAYNEAQSVADVVGKIRRQLPWSKIVVIDDGSHDTTAQEAVKAGAEAIILPFNLGIGGAVQAGLRYASRGNFDAVVEIDADGQHDPAQLSYLIEEFAARNVDMLIGSRFVATTSYKPSWLRMFGIRLFSSLIQASTKRTIYDSTSGYRVYSSRAVKFLANRYPADFPEPESIVMLLHAGFRISEASVTMTARTSGESVIGKTDFSLRAAYFVISNAIAILISSFKAYDHAR